LDFCQLFTVVFTSSDGWVIDQNLWCVGRVIPGGPAVREKRESGF
jgi:hypothetical protein